MLNIKYTFSFSLFTTFFFLVADINFMIWNMKIEFYSLWVYVFILYNFFYLPDHYSGIKLTDTFLLKFPHYKCVLFKRLHLEKCGNGMWMKRNEEKRESGGKRKKILNNLGSLLKSWKYLNAIFPRWFLHSDRRPFKFFLRDIHLQEFPSSYYAQSPSLSSSEGTERTGHNILKCWK